MELQSFSRYPWINSITFKSRLWNETRLLRIFSASELRLSFGIPKSSTRFFYGNAFDLKRDISCPFWQTLCGIFFNFHPMGSKPDTGPDKINCPVEYPSGNVSPVFEYQNNQLEAPFLFNQPILPTFFIFRKLEQKRSLMTPMCDVPYIARDKMPICADQ